MHASSTRVLQPVSCAFRDISAAQVEQLQRTASAGQIRLLASFLGLADAADPQSPEAILLDFYFYNLSFARGSGFSATKTSTLFSILKQLHEETTNSPFATLEDIFDKFKGLLVKHAVQRPPWSVQIFSLEDVKLITDYVSNTYFRHFKLYRYVFNNQQRLNLRNFDLPVETAPAVAALSEFQLWTPDLAAGLGEKFEAVLVPETASEPIRPDDGLVAPDSKPLVESNQGSNLPTPAPAASEGASIAASVATSDAKCPDVFVPIPDGSAAENPVETLAMQIEAIAAQSAQVALSKSITGLKEEIDKELKQHEEAMLQKLNKLIDSRRR